MFVCVVRWEGVKKKKKTPLKECSVCAGAVSIHGGATSYTHIWQQINEGLLFAFISHVGSIPLTPPEGVVCVLCVKFPCCALTLSRMSLLIGKRL